MFICIHCSLLFNTEQELNVHTTNCREKAPESSHLKSHICKYIYCKKSFTTAAELAAHHDTCKVKFQSLVTFYLTSINNNLNELRKAQPKKPEQLKPVECPSCLLKFGTVEEVTAHRKTCKLSVSRNIMEQLCTFVNAIWTDKQLPMISLPSTSSATSSDVMINPIDLVRALDSAWMPSPSSMPSTSKEKENEEKSSRKRVLDIDTKVDCATQTAISQVKVPPQVSEFSPSPKMFRSSIINKTNIETQRVKYECSICLLKFDSSEAFRAHLSQCPIKYPM